MSFLRAAYGAGPAAGAAAPVGALVPVPAPSGSSSSSSADNREEELAWTCHHLNLALRKVRELEESLRAVQGALEASNVDT